MKDVDGVYGWSHLKTVKQDGFAFHILDLQSQKWRSSEEVNKPIWRHWLTIVEPEVAESKQILLLIAGGNNGEAVPTVNPELVKLAEKSRSVVAEIRMIPNQDLQFTDEKENRCEDRLIAYTWDKFLTTQDPTWLARFPMTKAVVRAMDALEEASKNVLIRPLEVDGFFLAGRSKRGWTAWSVAGVDNRVRGVIPCVIDLLNLKRSMRHHYCSYGFWSEALRAYEEMKIPERVHGAEFQKLLEHVEPYHACEKITMPKYIINSTGDEFFVPDSSNFYFGELKGPKYLRYIPNTNHSLAGSNYNESVAAFYLALHSGKRLPEMRWEVAEGVVSVECDVKPAVAKVWRAHNPKGRDFRLAMIGPAWKSEVIERPYRVEIATPDEGWAACFVELTFENGFVLTTDVCVTPDILPYKFKEK